MDGDIVYRFAYVWVACWEVASFVHKLKGFSGWGDESRIVHTGCPRKNQSQNFDYVTRPYFVYIIANSRQRSRLSVLYTYLIYCYDYFGKIIY